MGRHAARRTRSSRWLLRVRAVLAGGLVLGLGATATLAAWNDSEYATTTVTSSRFGIVGNNNGGTFAEHPSSTGPALSFAPVLTGISPGATSFTTVGIQATSAATSPTPSTVGGTVQMQTSTAATGPLASALRYSVRVIAATATCDASVFSAAVPATSIIVPNDTPLTTGVVTPNTQTLTVTPLNTVAYCIRLSLPTDAPNTAQGGTATVVWQWLGTSVQ